MVIVWHPSQTNAITVNFELDRHAFADSTNMPVFATPQDLFFEYFLSQQCHQTKCPLTTKLHVRVGRKREQQGKNDAFHDPNCGFRLVLMKAK